MSNLSFLNKYQNILSKYADDNTLQPIATDYQKFQPEKDKSNFEAELEQQLTKIEKQNNQNSLDSTFLNQAYDQYLQNQKQPQYSLQDTQQYQQYFSTQSDHLNYEYQQFKDQYQSTDDKLNLNDIITNSETLNFLSSHFNIDQPIMMKHFIQLILDQCEINFKQNKELKVFKNCMKDKLTTKNAKELSLNALEIHTKDKGIYSFIEEIVKFTLKESEKEEKTKLHNQIVNELEMVKQMLDQKKSEVSDYEMNVLKMKNSLGDSFQQQYNILLKLMEESFQQKLQFLNKRVNCLESSLKNKIRIIEQKGQIISKRNLSNDQENQKLKQKVANLEKQLDYSRQKNQDIEQKLNMEKQAHQNTNEKLQQKIKQLEKKLNKAQSDISTISQQSTIINGSLNDVSNINDKQKSERSLQISTPKKEEEQKQSKIRQPKQNDEYLLYLFRIINNQSLQDQQVHINLHIEILPFIAYEHPIQMVWLTQIFYDQLCLFKPNLKFQPQTSIWKRKLKNSNLEKEIINIFKSYGEQKEIIISEQVDEYSQIQSKEYAGLIILKLAQTVQEQILGINILTTLIIKEQNEIYTSQLRNDYIQKKLIEMMMGVIKQNLKNQELAQQVSELLLELATQGFHYQEFLIQMSNQNQLGTLTDMMKSNMKNLELSEKISIIMQRVVFNNPELMNEQMKQVINQFKDKDLRGYTLLDWNVKSLINL